MIKGLIFDLDGVIVHTDKFHYLAWKQLAVNEGIYFDEIINNSLRGVSRLASLEIILKKASKVYTEEEKKAMLDYKNNLYREYLKTMNENDVSVEVIKTLKALKKQNLALAIGSSSKNAPYILERIKLIDWFDAISDGNNLTNSKPDPEVFLKAAKMLNLNPDELVVVEDAYAGIDAANAGGFISVGINDASNYDKANYKIISFKELLNIIKKVNG